MRVCACVFAYINTFSHINVYSNENIPCPFVKCG